MSVHYRRQPHAFTLLELVLVLVVLSVALAAAAPSMQGWSRGSKQRDAAEQFLAVTRGARVKAAADATMHRVYVDAQAGRYWIAAQSGTEFLPLGTSLGQIYELPEGNRIEVTDPGGQRMQYIDFFPSGRTVPARVSIISAIDDRRIVIECPSPSESFALVNAPQ